MEGFIEFSPHVPFRKCVADRDVYVLPRSTNLPLHGNAVAYGYRNSDGTYERFSLLTGYGEGSWFNSLVRLILYTLVLLAVLLVSVWLIRYSASKGEATGDYN